VVSGPRDHLVLLRRELINVLNDKRLKEIKFEEVRGHRPKIEAASSFYNLAIDYGAKRKIRIDVLTWDLQDSRHTVVRRDDIANLHRMYYKVLTNLSLRWRINEWKLIPDENSAIDWREIRDFLNKTRFNRPKPELLRLFESSEEYKFFIFHSVVPRCSHKEPLIQLADLFAGIASFSRDKGSSFIRWLDSEESKHQLVLFDREEDVPEDLSKGDLVRFHLMKAFRENCIRNKLGVSISTKCYLHTFKPENPINFWNYEPQHEMDKAPIKSLTNGRGSI
jgi:hypothetical protein